MKTLIVGARGLVGSALKRQIPLAIEGIPVEPKKHTKQVYTDITKYESLFKVFSNFRPDVVYLAASIANVEQCEKSKGTDTVNVAGALTTLRLCESFGAKMVYFSSSYVFNGEKRNGYKESDETSPINYYGVQKCTVEESIIQSGIDSIVVRTVGVYGTERLKKNFAKQVISTVFSNRQVFAPSDQYMNPILSDDLARITIRLVERNYRGLIHVAGDTCMSKYEFAVRIAKYFGLENLVVPVKTSEMHQAAKRPMNGCLDCVYLGKLGFQIPSFDGGLAKFMSQEYNG
jgi:dTDP-4-dehydrorhamnose reductase